MASGGNNSNDSPEIVPAREITAKIEKTFLVRGRMPISFLNGPNAAASIAPTLIRHWADSPDQVPVPST